MPISEFVAFVVMTLRRAGILVAIGGIDPGMNEHVRHAFAPHGQLQCWLLIPKHQYKAALKVLKQIMRAVGVNRRPIRARAFDGNPTGIAYGAKWEFFRRISHPRERQPDGPMKRRNTQHRRLRVDDECQLALLLDREGLCSRLILHGVRVAEGSNGPRLEFTNAGKARKRLRRA